MIATRHRPDIDGLRAVAVVPVVLFHCGLAGFGGGFVGVDIFFTISGFLITGILFRRLSVEGRIEILEFYARRVARLFPSLLLVVVVTLLMGVLLLSTALFEVQSLTKSAVAGLGFFANFYFWVTTSDYFAADASDLPLLHLWSLAVEEQYYLVWPFVMMLSASVSQRSGRLRHFSLAAVGAITIGSLACSAWLTSSNVTEAFYLPFSRFWELGIGSAVALLTRRPTALETAVSGSIGISLLVLAIVAIRQDFGFPFPMALLPVLGTALILWSGQADHPNLVARLLAISPLRSIGNVSYAWYLWHWPLLAFAHILTFGTASLALKLGLALGSLALSYATVRLFENPLRLGFPRRATPKAVVMVGAAASLSVMVMAGGCYTLSRTGVFHDDVRIAASFNDRPARQQICLLKDFGTNGHIASDCLAPASQPTVFLWGDSHADQWSPAVEQWARSQPGWKVEQVTLAACPPLIGLTPTHPVGAEGTPYDACKRIDDAALNRLALNRPTVAVLGGNWLPRAGIARTGIRQYFESYRGNAASSLKYFEIGLEHTLAQLQARRIPALVVLQSPYQSFIPAACVERRGSAGCFIDYTAFERDAEKVNSVIRRIVLRHDNSRTLDPTRVLCAGARCDSEIDGRIAYFDAEHVAASMAASARSMREWRPLLTSLAKAAMAPYRRTLFANRISPNRATTRFPTMIP